MEMEMEMENNDLITVTSIEERKALLLGMDEISEPQPECCIYKVPKYLRKINEEAYTPQVISIGPFHHGEKELVAMEKQKIRYQREFSKRISMETWQELITFIEDHEQHIHNCYEEMPKFQKLDFITMILYDAIFIIELFLRYYYGKTDFFIKRNGVIAVVRVDLILLENQLPYFILEGLYMLAFPKHNDPNRRSYPSFLFLCCAFLLNDEASKIPLDEIQVKHFVDLVRYVLTIAYQKPHLEGRSIDLPYSAVKLKESGVTFKGVKEHDGLLDIKFERTKLFIPLLKDHNELQIPRIEISDETEYLFRNLMALEQCQYPLETHFCNYIDLMDCLINTEEDVNLLVEAGILTNFVGDSARIAKMFNDLCLRIGVSDSCFYDIVKDLKAHSENPWNHTKATLKRVYFSNYWRGTATIAAIVLLFLTLIQTICSILQVV